MEHLQYPIGRFLEPTNVTASQRLTWIEKIENLPMHLEKALEQITEDELATPYRPGGWTVRQVVHHLADSHVNGFCRLHLALTEEQPTIKPYMEDRWAKLPDANLPIDCSLEILRGIHKRWAFLLKSMDEADFQRSYIHPEYGKHYSLDTMTALYAWHGEHHVGHVRLVVGLK